jgi:SWI/SNF-related matrix-associated actin-dependent regulator of chromatin subfamily A member 5
MIFYLSQRKGLNLNMLSLAKRERKTNYSVDNYFKDTLRAGPSKTEKGPKIPRAPKQIPIQDFQFFPPELAELQERELAAFKRANKIPATVRDAVPEDTQDTLDSLNEELEAAQAFIDSAEPLTDAEQAKKEVYISQGFPNWSRRDFQQLVKALEAHGWDAGERVLSAEIQEKSERDVKQYMKTFTKKWKTLPEAERIEARIAEGNAKREKRDNLETLLGDKIAAVKYPMQELDLSYPTTKGKVYSEEEDRYLLCRLHYYGMQTEDVYEKIKRDILEFPVFRFDWFLKSRSPQELQRRCNTLLGMIEKEAQQEAELKAQEEAAASTKSKGKKRGIDHVQVSDKDSRSSTPNGSTVKRASKKKKT